MIYQEPIRFYRLADNAGAPLPNTLVPITRTYCAELTINSRRYFDSVQAGSKIDALVEVPSRYSVRSGDFAEYRTVIYRVEQVEDITRDSSPAQRLSLHRPDARYEIAKEATANA